VNAKIVKGWDKGKMFNIHRGKTILLNNNLFNGVVEDSQLTAKLKITQWQSGSARAQFSINHHHCWKCQQ